MCYKHMKKGRKTVWNIIFTALWMIRSVKKLIVSIGRFVGDGSTKLTSSNRNRQIQGINRFRGNRRIEFNSWRKGDNEINEL